MNGRGTIPQRVTHVCFQSRGSQEVVCPPGAFFKLQTVRSGKRLCDEVDHSEINPSPNGTDGYSMDIDPDEIGYISDYVLNLSVTAPPRVLPQQRAGPQVGLIVHVMHADLVACIPAIPVPQQHMATWKCRLA